MSTLFTDHNRKCVACGGRAGAWPIGDDDVATCPTCGARQEKVAAPFKDDCPECGEYECVCREPGRASRLFTNATIAEERWDADRQRMIYRVEYDEEVESVG